MPLQSIIFDFDGLMLDTETAEYTGWSAVYRDFGVELDIHDWANCVGRAPEEWRPETHLSSLLDREIDSKAVRIEAARIRDEILIGLEPLPGIIELLEDVARERVPVAIASSSRSVWVEGLLANIGMRDQFLAIRTRDMVGKAKPWPDLYLAACEAINVDPRYSVALEDSPVGITSAVSADMSVVVVPNFVTQNYDLSAAHLHLETMSEFSVARARELVEQRLSS